MSLVDTAIREARTIEEAAARIENDARSSSLVETTTGFISRALAAIPSWAVGTIGTMLGFGLALSLLLVTSGLKSPVARVLESFAVSVERSSSKFDEAANKLDRVVARLDQMQTRYEAIAVAVAAHDQRLSAVETKVDAIAAATIEPSDQIRIGNRRKKSSRTP